MIHFKPSAILRSLRMSTDAVATSPGMLPAQILPSQGLARAYGRADHARMLAHAAKRRRSAQAASGVEDCAYWKACAPAAVAKAVTIRADAGFARLP